MLRKTANAYDKAGRYLYAGANPVGMIDDGHSPYYSVYFSGPSFFSPSFYASRWHPTRWYVQARFPGWVSWGFRTWGRANFHRDDGYDTHHRIDIKLDGRLFTYIDIQEARSGRNDQAWRDLNVDIDKQCTRFPSRWGTLGSGTARAPARRVTSGRGSRSQRSGMGR